MELIMLLVALFIFMFGSVIAFRLLEFGLAVGDKALEASGAIMKLPFRILFYVLKLVMKLSLVILKRVFMKMNVRTNHEFTITPIFKVTPVELQKMRNHNLVHSGKRTPIQIEHPPIVD